ncbi:MAG: DUF6272 family protein [Flavobacteriales bacterium]
MNNLTNPFQVEIGQQWSVEARDRRCAQDGRTIVFAHQGELTQDGLAELVAIAEHYSLVQCDDVSTRKRLVGVLVEGLENAHRHVTAAFRQSIFAVLTCNNERYMVAVGNAMPIVTAALLSHRVSILNEMDDVDVKEHYLKLLSNTGRTKSGGAGLGLLTMARKSRRPVSCISDRLDAAHVGFAMELVVVRG